MEIEKANDNSNPASVRMVNATPDALRTIAERLEVESRRVTLKGECVYYSLTPGIMLVYKAADKP